MSQYLTSIQEDTFSNGPRQIQNFFWELKTLNFSLLTQMVMFSGANLTFLIFQLFSVFFTFWQLSFSLVGLPLTDCV